MKSGEENLLDNIHINSGIGKKIGIVKSLWNSKITDRLYTGCKDTFLKYGVEINNIHTLLVPGSFELIHGGKKLHNTVSLDAIILIGSIIQGDTPHFNFISQATANGTKDLNILFDIPFIFCVSTDLNMQQAMDRSGGKMGNKGIDSALTALQLIQNNTN